MSIAAAAFEPQKTDAFPTVFEQSLQGWIPDQRANWSDCHCTLIAAIAWNTPESIHEQQPVRHAASGVVVAADCRLDNRDEVESERRSEGDCELILRAWLRWGEDCVRHLLGDFAFAVWDPREQVLFCATDPFGCRPLYYARIGKGVLVATDPAVILGHPAMDCSISPQWLAENLARISGTGLETPFIALNRLPGGHSLTVREDIVSERQYWKPQPGSLAGLGTERAIIEEGRHLLSEAVACRLRTAWPVGGELTGGLDSSGIVATALPVLRAKGEDLAVFSRLRPASHSFLGPDESAGVISLCEHLGIQRRFVSACTGPGLLDLLRGVMDRHAIPLCPWSIFSEEMRELAAREGIRTMLSGFAGDNCFSASEMNLPVTEPWLHNTQWRWNHRRAAAQRQGNGHALKPLAKAVLASLIPRLNYLKTTFSFEPDSAGPLTAAIMASSEFRAAAARRASASHRQFGALKKDLRVCLLENRQLQFRIASSALLAKKYKQVWTYPLLDRRLIEFSLACPPQIRTANGFSRRLARLIIEDRIPSSLAWNPRKGRETIPGAMEQVFDNGDAIRARLDAWRGDPLVSSVFDLGRAADALCPPSPGPAGQWVASACGIVDVLQIGDFLTRHASAGLQAVEALRIRAQAAG